MTTFFHVTASDNRASIERYGLDWTRMGDMCGVAGSLRPEVEGVFLCRDEGEAEFFCRMDANGGPVDVWAVEGATEADLVESPEGFLYLPEPISPDRLTLWQSMRMPEPVTGNPPATAYHSTLTITVADGRVVSGDEAHDWARRRASPSE